jgi:hypothetical protein
LSENEGLQILDWECEYENPWEKARNSKESHYYNSWISS